MNPCSDAYKIKILDYLTGNLSKEDSAEVAAHLERCSQCREAVEELGVLPYIWQLDDIEIQEEIEQEAAADQRKDRKASSLKERVLGLPVLLPAGALAVAALALLIFNILHVPDVTDSSHRQMARLSTKLQLQASTWQPLFEGSEHADFLFQPYQDRQELSLISKTPTLGTVSDYSYQPSTETEALIRMGYYLFAVTDESTGGKIISTAVLLDRSRSLFVALDVVPEKVLLRRTLLTREENAELARVDHEVAFVATRVAQDEEAAIALLHAPGVQHFLPENSGLATGLSTATLSGELDCFLAAFSQETTPDTQTDSALSPLFYFDLDFPFEFSENADGEHLVSCDPLEFEDTVLPRRFFVFAGETTGLTGILDFDPDQQEFRFLQVEIANLVNKASAKIHSSQADFERELEQNAAFKNSLEGREAITIEDSEKTGNVQCHPYSAEAYVLTFDRNRDGVPEYAIHCDYPGVLVAWPLPGEAEADEAYQTFFRTMKQILFE
ncbi:MAG: zf-HC2 domain-containing protein [Candidatus Hydrogenedens sp.]|jgi:hypothetical protein|nr:zf-HC2 domain-containing protein [Candidatus Hydrogenedens sp.]